MSKADEILVLKFQEGDKKALNNLVKRWHITFCRKAYWIVKDANLSKDIAQETWQVIIDKIHSLKDPQKFKNWALRIVYSKSLDALRKQNRERLKKSELAEEHVYVDDVNNEKEQLKEALLKAIETLPEQQQTVVRLFYKEDYSLKEMSQILNISVGTAKSRLFHAREKLKLKLQKERNKY